MRGHRLRHGLIAGVAGAAVLSALAIEPMAQDPAYHLFADTRRLLGVPNFWNVATNLLFLLVGVAGLSHVAGSRSAAIAAALKPAYLLFFAGVLLTGFGSAWYHLAPDNASMVWDRLPMTLAFMSLLTIVLGEQVSQELASRLLLPLALAGVAAVLYWRIGEAAGHGDLRPYALVQYVPILLIPLLLILYPSPFDRCGFFWGMIAVYVLAKVLEHFDAQIFDASSLVSGHALKHVAAALAPLILLRGLRVRKPRFSEPGPATRAP